MKSALDLQRMTSVTISIYNDKYAPDSYFACFTMNNSNILGVFSQPFINISAKGLNQLQLRWVVIIKREDSNTFMEPFAII